MAMQESQVNALELERVLTKLRTAFEQDDMFYSSIKKRNVEKISNRLMRVPIKLRPGGSFGYFNPNGGDLGRGGGPTYDKAVLQSVFMVEAIEYTKLAEWSTDSDRKSVLNGVRELIANAFDEIRRQIDAQMMQPGTGVIGTVTTDTPAGGSNVITLTTDGFGNKLMRYGQTVQVFDSTLATLRGSGVITFQDPAMSGDHTINITPQIAGVVAGDLIVTNGLSAPASLPALYGVPYHHSNASTGTWLGFNRATTPEIRSNRVNGGGAALQLPLPRLAVNSIGYRIGAKEDYNVTAWMNPCQIQAYEEIGQLAIAIFKQAKDENLNMYFGNGLGSGMQIAGVRMKGHNTWDKTRIDFVVDELWGRGEIMPLGFYKTDGRNIFEIRGASGGVATSDIFYMINGMQTFVSNPAGTAYIDNLAIPDGY